MTTSSRQHPLAGSIAVITGGSKGIGKATAREYVRLGGSVCIVARDKKALQEASEEISSLITRNGQFVETISADTTNMDVLKPRLDKFIKDHGVPQHLINCVGYAYPNYIDRLNIDDFRKNMETNYFGQLVPILVLLPHFMKERRGYIANCSSLLGLMGMMGYATYVPSKYAISGLTETLRHELKPYNIGCSVVFPPDTNTPGFEHENITKPAEVTIMSEGGGLLEPEKVGEAFVKGILKGRFYILPGQSAMIWRISRHFPRLMQWIMDGEYRKAKKKAAAG
ncbi:MAG: SDR family oxidoreductase [Spirochaetes bacterium]|nr:SDR family oxidoreductase [Spirochaetota bacterium]